MLGILKELAHQDICHDASLGRLAPSSKALKVAILTWLPEPVPRSGIMPHLLPSWRILLICINAVRRRRPRHGRHQKLELTHLLFFGLGLPDEALYIGL